MKFDLSVYFVADPAVCGGRDICDVVRAALDGGVTLVQYRDKLSEERDVYIMAERLARVVEPYDHVPFLLNDYVQMAADIGVDGVHIGQGDMKPVQARAVIGEGKILGLTAFTEEQISAVDPALIDYIGTGPFYATKTKPDKAVLGSEKFSELVALSPVPVVGIGGIEVDNAAAVIEAGADGVAMMRAVSEADDIAGAARAFVEVVRGG